MRTPYFIAYPNKILENYHIMQSILPVEEVFYSTKPNVENITFDALAKGNASFDIVKLSEMKRLVRLGVVPNKIICSLPIKNSYEIKKMYELGCRYFVYNCEQEYKKLIELAPSALKIARIKIDDKENEGIEYGLSKKELITMNF